MQPKLTIDQFSGMLNEGFYSVEAMRSKKINGQSFTKPAGIIDTYHSDSDDGFSSLDLMDDMSIMPLTDPGGTTRRPDYIVGISGDKIYAWDITFTGNSKGEIHDIINDEIHNHPAISSTKDGDLLYATKTKVGVGWDGKCAPESTDSQIVDKDGVDLTTRNISTSTGSNKVINVSTGEIHTITAISTTNSTNDTMEFNTGSTTNSDGDQYLAFVDENFDFFSAITSDHFQTQPDLSTWQRQMVLWENFYYFLNGNYIARLPAKQSDWSAANFEEDHKQLFYNVQATCMDYNTNMLLIGGNYFQKGKLMLWDGWTFGFNDVINVDAAPTSIVAKDDGWVVLINSTLYYTNGHSLQKLSTFPLVEFEDSIASDVNDMTTMGDEIYISAKNLTRHIKGVLIYNFEQGWRYIPTSDGSKYGYNSDLGALYPVPERNKVFCSYEQNFTNYIGDIRPEISKRGSSIFYTKISQPTQFSVIGLNLVNEFNDHQNTKRDVDITVNYGTGKIPASSRTSIDEESSTADKIYNTSGSTSPGIEGQKIMMLNSNVAGEISYIESINNPGTDNEEWNISPSLSAAPDSSADRVRMYDLFKTQTKTINNFNIPEEIYFSIPSFYSDKLFVEVFMDSSEYIPIGVQMINLY